VKQFKAIKKGKALQEQIKQAINEEVRLTEVFELVN
jgi:hypothetical protein